MARSGASEPTTAARGSRPSAYAAGDVTTADWPTQAADTIERVVGVVRDSTTGRAITVARGLVLGAFAVFVGTAVAILLAITAVRALVVYLPDAAFGEQHVWAAHTIVGTVFTLPGLWALRKARRPPATPD